MTAVCSQSSPMAQPLSAELCAKCHQKQWNSWIKSKHRLAAHSLPFPKRRNLKCRSCHDDAGMRRLIRRQFESRVTKVKSSQQAHMTGVDCLSCHGLESVRLSQTVSKQTQHQVALSFNHVCDRCHNLPPMDSLKGKCYSVHSLQKKESSFCKERDMKHKSHTAFPAGLPTDQNLKN